MNDWSEEEWAATLERAAELNTGTRNEQLKSAAGALRDMAFELFGIKEQLLKLLPEETK